MQVWWVYARTGQPTITISPYVTPPALLWSWDTGWKNLCNDVGSKSILTPLIPNCYVLCTPAILKTFVIRSFFFKKWLLTHVFGGSQVQKSSFMQALIGF